MYFVELSFKNFTKRYILANFVEAERFEEWAREQNGVLIFDRGLVRETTFEKATADVLSILKG